MGVRVGWGGGCGWGSQAGKGGGVVQTGGRKIIAVSVGKEVAGGG